MSKVFGVRPAEVIGRSGQDRIPNVVRDLFSFLANNALETEGVFRVSPAVKELEAAKNQIDKGTEVDLTKYNHHLVAGLLKAYFLELPEPLMTFELYESFIAAANASTAECKSRLIKLIASLPAPNRALSECLFLFLHKMAALSETNKMTNNNLAIVFGQILLRPKIETLELLRHAPKITSVVRLMVEEYWEIFPKSKEDEELISKGNVTARERLIGVPSPQSVAGSVTPTPDTLTPEQRKLNNLKETVEEAIESVLAKLDEMSADLAHTNSLEDTIEVAKRIRTAKRILFNTPEGMA